ncbi:hypothetical protein PA7_34100 [Pseudonocardia asaccharolytica DSM 44247 = NBRC 16224]|uniref:Uncharacterized protein n=1 Tax=Pseudonocardia asaccharolytica DSM 44247 = NBRC 16224 TaxID=1123024 RepID=A0A511D529_9PSEU|nr:hypothetical protein [Pseudonocardia asaccharolytica]GEL19573.1 hypothetical protein PA7_34100 [Pseudonocardia asaccharolytica DSM 44247 = NBRC 16224]
MREIGGPARQAFRAGQTVGRDGGQSDVRLQSCRPCRQPGIVTGADAVEMGLRVLGMARCQRGTDQQEADLAVSVAGLHEHPLAEPDRLVGLSGAGERLEQRPTEIGAQRTGPAHVVPRRSCAAPGGSGTEGDEDGHRMSRDVVGQVLQDLKGLRVGPGQVLENQEHAVG